MKVSELRIGNYVYFHGDVEEINIDHFNIFNILKDGILLPIPLTEEWLLRFGFEKINSELTNIAPLNLRCTFNLPNTPFSFCQGKLILTTGTGDFCVNTEYVHQLQNLYFALTSEELTITKP
jgi:hypothetical protein